MTDPIADGSGVEGAPSHPLFAAVYDPVMRPVEADLLVEHREYLSADLHGSVLDLGAGTGAMFPYFARAVDRDQTLSVHAIEPDSHMRRRARRAAEEANLDVDLRSAGAQSLPYDVDSFDVVVASLVFCTIPNVEAALDEVARVLRPNGEFRFLEHVRADGWMAGVQAAVDPIWRIGAAGCHLTRETGATFRADDRFEVVDFSDLDVGVASVMPLVRGTLVRR